jgi:tetratricopeptide (TPR) repeat protein
MLFKKDKVMKLSRSCIACMYSIVSGIVFTASAAGLPGEHLVSDRWRTLHATISPLSNPAFLMDINYTSLRVALNSSLNQFYLTESGVTVPIGLYQSLGVSWLALNSRGLDETVILNGDITATGARARDNHNFFMATYAVNPLQRLNIGVNLNLAHQNLFGRASRIGFGVDLGLSYPLLRHLVLGQHTLGIMAQNLIAPQLGSDEAYSRNLRISWLGAYSEDRVKSRIDFSIKDFPVPSKAFGVYDSNGVLTTASGAPAWECSGLIDLWVRRMVKLSALGGISPDGLQFAGGGVGINIPSVNNGRDFEFLYQFTSVFNDNAPSHTFYVRADIGRHREESYAKHMSSLLQDEPTELYNRALALYRAGNFWDAFFLFGRVHVEYPDFFKNDWVAYYIAGCMENFDMREKSAGLYTTTIANYPRSEAVPLAELGLMRLYYRMGEVAKMEETLKKLQEPGKPDSLKYHGYYLLGQSAVQSGSMQTARKLLAKIPAGHPDYVFALHTLAVVNLMTDSVETAIENLLQCAQASVKEPDQKEIQNRSYLLLGYIYYEDARPRNQTDPSGSGFARAVAALRKIPATSIYYEDAQLGLGWSALKSAQWADCAVAGKYLGLSGSVAAIRCEGFLLQGYALMSQKDYAGAAEVMSKAPALFPYIAPPTPDSLNTVKKGYQATRSAYKNLAESVYDAAMSLQSPQTQPAIDSMRAEQKKSKSRINYATGFFDKVKRAQLFSRMIGAVKEDVEYALAYAQRMAALHGSAKVQNETLEKQKKIDVEIQKLEEKLDNIPNQ